MHSRGTCRAAAGPVMLHQPESRLLPKSVAVRFNGFIVNEGKREFEEHLPRRKLVILETKIERLDDDKVKFDITIEAAEVDEAIDAVYAEAKKSAMIPGFRPGKAPRTVLEHTYGAEYFTTTATVNLIEKHSPEVVDGNDMIPLGDYDYDADDVVEAGKDYAYSFTIQVKPELELTSADPVKVQLLRTEATEEEIDQQIELLRSYYIDLNPVTDRPVQDNDIVIYSQVCSKDGEEIEEGKEDRSTYIVGGSGSTEEFDEQVKGMSIGDTKEFEMPANKLKLGYKYSGPITAKVTVEEITEKVIPELTDEWVKENCDVEDIAALREQVGDSITSSKSQNLERDKSIACLEELTSRLVGEIPSYLQAQESTRALTNFYNNLQQQGFTLDQYLEAVGETSDEFYEAMSQQGEILAKQDLALDALAREQGIEVTEEDIDDAFANSGVEDPDGLRREWEEEYKMSTLREEILRDKTAQWLYTNAEVEFVDELPEKEPEEPEDAEEAAAEAGAEEAAGEAGASEAAEAAAEDEEAPEADAGSELEDE